MKAGVIKIARKCQTPPVSLPLEDWVVRYSLDLVRRELRQWQMRFAEMSAENNECSEFHSKASLGEFSVGMENTGDWLFSKYKIFNKPIPLRSLQKVGVADNVAP